MISRAVLLAAVLPATLAAATVHDTAGAYAANQLAADVPARKLLVTGQVAKLCTAIAGAAYPHSAIEYWADASTTVWALTARGKHGPITAGFVVRDDRIRDCRVLADSERRGRPIRSRRFLRQFEGLGLHDNGKLDHRVDGITGATISSVAMKKMALLALSLDRLRKSRYTQGAKTIDEESSQ